MRQELETDRKLALSLVKSIEIIGEAASRVSKECQDNLLQIPWANIITMRNCLIHAYFDINLDIVCNTITQDISPLIGELEKIIASFKKG